MKKSILFSTAAAVLALGMATSSTVFAADDATGTTTSEFTVTAGSKTPTKGDPSTPDGVDKDLVLTQIPDLNFGETGVAELISGTTLNYKKGDVQKTTKDVAENQTGDIAVVDNRGTNAGWTLAASIDQPYNGTTYLNGTLNLLANGTKFTNTALTAALPLTAALSTNGTSVVVWSAKTNEGEGLNTASVTKPELDEKGTVTTAGTTFKLDPNTLATPGQYDATISWYLTSAPETNK